jgi:hypothetical protein
MAASFLKMAPTIVVVAASAACAWPYLWGPLEAAPPGPKEAPLPEIKAALLEPAVGTNFDRDPFQETAAARLALARPAFARLQARVVGWFRRRPADDPGDGTYAATGKVEAAGPGADLVLNGTFLQGERRLAVINGRVYAPGEPLKGLDAARGRYVLAEVRPLAVVIDAPGRRLELSYRGPSSAPPAGPSRRPATTAGGAAPKRPVPRAAAGPPPSAARRLVGGGR